MTQQFPFKSCRNSIQEHHAIIFLPPWQQQQQHSEDIFFFKQLFPVLEA